MSTESSETTSPVTKAAGSLKFLTILAGGALAMSLVNTVLIVLNPTASKVEQFNENLKTDMAESIASIHKKMDGLKSAEMEWQAVLKISNEKPDAIFKIVKSTDGLLTLTEIQQQAAETPEPLTKEPMK